MGVLVDFAQVNLQAWCHKEPDLAQVFEFKRQGNKAPLRTVRESHSAARSVR